MDHIENFSRKHLLVFFGVKILLLFDVKSEILLSKFTFCSKKQKILRDKGINWYDKEQIKETAWRRPLASYILLHGFVDI